MESKYPIILASQSPRRKELLEKLGLKFTVETQETPENFPSNLNPMKVAEFLARKKSAAFQNLSHDHILITADTVVIVNGEILEKPNNVIQAKEMLKKLSGKSHYVVSGVCIRFNERLESFSDKTEVTFKELHDHEVNFYIEKFKPFDKAGSYGVQEWIGLIGVTKLSGSYFTVMGMPIQKVYEYLYGWALKF